MTRPQDDPAAPGTSLASLLEQRVRLEDRLAELHRVAADLGATPLSAGAVATLQRLKAAVARLDSELTGLANAVHAVVRETSPAPASGAPAAEIAQLMVVRAGESRFALRVDAVREVRSWHGRTPAKSWRERDLDVTPLAAALGLAGDAGSADADHKLIVLEAPAGRALLVDEITRQDELVVRPLGPLVAGPFAGAVTVAQDELLLVLDLAALAA